VLVIGAVGCGSKKAATLHTPDQLGTALLAASDLGATWTQVQSQVFTARNAEIPTLDPNMWCPAGASRAAALVPLTGDAGAIRGFSTPKSGHTSHLVEEQLWSNADVTKYVTKAGDLVKACTGATWADPDKNPITMTALTGPSVGDQRVYTAEKIVTQAPYGQFEWRTRTAVVRVGSSLLLLQESDVQPIGSAPLMSDAEWSTVVTTATAKLEALDK
jgi:hypothetical protein